MTELVRFSCPQCGRRLKAPVGTAGRTARCRCRVLVRIPDATPRHPLSLGDEPEDLPPAEPARVRSRRPVVIGIGVVGLALCVSLGAGFALAVVGSRYPQPSEPPVVPTIATVAATPAPAPRPVEVPKVKPQNRKPRPDTPTPTPAKGPTPMNPPAAGLPALYS